MVDTAIEATITIEVAEENPPRNAKIAKDSAPLKSGTLKTKRSGFAVAGNKSRPITAIGIIKSEISIK
jgi:hypothetical protein